MNLLVRLLGIFVFSMITGAVTHHFFTEGTQFWVVLFLILGWFELGQFFVELRD